MTTLKQWDQILSAGIDAIPGNGGNPANVLTRALSAMRDRARDLGRDDAVIPAGSTRCLWRVPWPAGDLIVAAHSDADAVHQADSWLRAQPHLITGDTMPDWKGAEPVDSPVCQVPSEEERVRQADKLAAAVIEGLKEAGLDPRNDEQVRNLITFALRTAVS